MQKVINQYSYELRYEEPIYRKSEKVYLSQSITNFCTFGNVRLIFFLVTYFYLYSSKKGFPYR